MSNQIEAEDRVAAEDAKTKWREIAAKYPHYVAVPGFRDAILGAWVRQPSRSMDDIASEIVAQWDRLREHFTKHE